MGSALIEGRSDKCTSVSNVILEKNKLYINVGLKGIS